MTGTPSDYLHNNRWKVCPITLSALALLDDDALDGIAGISPVGALFMNKIGRWTTSSAHPRLVPAWRGIDHLELVARDLDSLLIDIRFDRPSGGGGLRYAGCRLLAGGRMPLTMVAGAAGADMGELLPHPVFLGHRWACDQTAGDALLGPPCDIALGDRPFERLAEAASGERDNVAASMRALGLG